MGTTLYLVRHGETDCNRNQLLCGWGDPPLNGRGRKQAVAAAMALKNVDFHHAYSSGLKRATETAQIILQNREQEVKEVPLLREIHFGEYEGKTMAWIEKNAPDRYQAMATEGVHFQFPGGESLAQMHQRVVQGVEALRQQHPGEQLLVVSHGGVIRSILAHYIGGDMNKHWSFRIDHGSVTVLELHGDFYLLNKMNEGWIEEDDR